MSEAKDKQSVDLPQSEEEQPAQNKKEEKKEKVEKKEQKEDVSVLNKKFSLESRRC